MHPNARNAGESSEVRPYTTHSNMLVGVVHHCNEHVQKHDKGDDIVRAKHGGAHKLGKFVFWIHISHIERNQAEYGPI